jgi:hypothetical protein
MTDCEVVNLPLNHTQTIWLTITMSLLALTYTICLVFACHNFVRHIILGKRLHNWLLLTFYLLVVLICVFRILSISLFGTLFVGLFKNGNQRIYWSD